ncbi:hypothetical protein BC943DRAFT_317674 [Umbelopsis sp. AD052]|nr:hypothetical protein BC943DRAFT_317674 [Umbelopsis sp. AD052]
MKVNILLALLAVSGTALAQLPIVDPNTSTTAASSSTTTTESTTSAPPPPTSTTTTSSEPTSSSPPPASSSVPSSSSSVPASSTVASTSAATTSAATTSNSKPPTSIAPSTTVTLVSASTTASISGTPTPTNPPPNDSSNKTGVIAGATVGGIVGLALIAGILTWINRKGGCTRRRKRDADFDDYGLDDHDFPARPMGTTSAAAAAVGAGAMASGARQEPTLPQFGGDQYYDDQYGNNGARRFVPSYQPQLQQHPDYYNQQQGQYYNYSGNPGSDHGFSDTTYNDQNYYGAGAAGGYYEQKTDGAADTYKPDDAAVVENKPHEKL